MDSRSDLLPGLTEITWSRLTGALGSTTVWGSMASGRMPDLQERMALEKPSKIVKNSWSSTKNYQALRTSFLRMWTSGERYLDASVNSHLISDSSGAGRMVAFCLWSVVPDKCGG
jgi:hypothetical protein